MSEDAWREVNSLSRDVPRRARRCCEGEDYDNYDDDDAVDDDDDDDNGDYCDDDDDIVVKARTLDLETEAQGSVHYSDEAGAEVFPLSLFHTFFHIFTLSSLHTFTFPHFDTGLPGG